MDLLEKLLPFSKKEKYIRQFELFKHTGKDKNLGVFKFLFLFYLVILLSKVFYYLKIKVPLFCSE